MLKLGDKNIGKLYLGYKAISKAYLGDKLVYQAGKPIFLDYIKFDGASWINTGIVHQTCTVETTIRFEENGTRQLMGFGSSTAQYWGKPANSVIIEGLAGSNVTDKTDVTIEYNCDDSSAPTIVRKADGKTSAVSTGRTVGTMPYIIGALVWGSSATTNGYQCTCEIWRHKFTINGEVVQDLRPCIDPKGTVCMYDMVTKKYFYNQGTGTLTAGNIIQFVDYIAFDGNSWIDTGISYQDCTVECGLTCPATSDRELMGWASNASTYWGITNGQFELGGGYVLTKSDTTKYSEVKIEVAISDKRYLTLSHAGNSIKREGNIGSGTYNYAIGAMPNTYSYGFIGNLYFHRFISPDGVLIQDLRPCLFNGVACFYDMVTGKIFNNAGTGTLKAGGEINLASFTIVGTATIDNGIVSNLNETSYITTKTNYGLPTASSWSIIFPTIKVNEFSKYFWGTNAERSGIVLAVNSNGKIVVYISSNGTQWDIASGINNLYSNLEFSKGEDVNIRLDFTGSKYVLYILKDNAWQEQTSVTSSLKVGYFEHFRIGQWTNYYRFDSTMDLKTFTVVADGKVTSALKQR